MELSNCYARPISRNTFNLNVTGLFRQTITPRVHFLLNYRFNSFQKYMIDRWEDPCGFFNGTGDAAVFRILYDDLRHIFSWHACPLRCNETFSMISERLAADNHLIDSIFPAGKYRFDVLIATDDHKLFVMLMEIFFIVSEHGVWY